MRDNRTNKQTLKIELLSQWKLEAEFRKYFRLPFKKILESRAAPLFFPYLAIFG